MDNAPLYPRTREQVLADPATRNLVWDVLEQAKGKDMVDAYQDVQTAANILRAEMEKALMA